MTIPDADLLKLAHETVAVGAEIVMPFFENGVSANGKDGGASYDLVTDADVACERAITSLIAERYPDHAILGEEGETDGPMIRSVDDPLHEEDYLWIVDPIDGTTNFAHGIPHFGISVACYHYGKPIVGVILNPARDDRYEAVQSGGAKKNGKPIQVSKAKSLSECLVGCGFYYDRGGMMRATLAAVEEVFSHDIHGIRRMGTASLDLCQVACGMYGGFFEYQLSPWDFAAGRLILTEAGGQITDGRGNDLPLKKTSVLASNTKLHETLVDITGRHHPAD